MTPPKAKPGDTPEEKPEEKLEGQLLRHSAAGHHCAQVARLLRSQGIGVELAHAGGVAVPLRGVVVDSRRAEAGLLFVARQGGQQDGHDYIAAALEQGCRSFLVSRSWWDGRAGRTASGAIGQGSTFLVVDGDTEPALLAWARAYRQSMRGLFVLAISGSYAKTSTKELLGQLLAQRYSCALTPQNRNTPVGCALTLLGLSVQTQVAVLELGIDHPGEMDLLCSIVQPNAALITGIGTAHIGAFASQEQLAGEKGRIYAQLQASGATLWPAAPLALLPAGAALLDILQAQVPANSRSCYYSAELAEQRGNWAEDLGLAGLRLHYGGLAFTLPLLGLHSQQIFWAAAAAAEALGLVPAEIAAGAAGYRPLFGRGQLLLRRLRRQSAREASQESIQESPEQGPELQLLQDCYNASPESVYALVEMLGQWRCRGLLPPCVLVLADMLELGRESQRSHRLLGDKLVELGRCFNAPAPHTRREDTDRSSELAILLYGEAMQFAQKVWQVWRQAAPQQAVRPALRRCRDLESLSLAAAQELRRLALLPGQLRPLLVLKGARGMYLEKIAQNILR